MIKINYTSNAPNVPVFPLAFKPFLPLRVVRVGVDMTSCQMKSDELNTNVKEGDIVMLIPNVNCTELSIINCSKCIMISPCAYRHFLCESAIKVSAIILYTRGNPDAT